MNDLLILLLKGIHDN